jgi:uncharacterized membrane protein
MTLESSKNLSGIGAFLLFIGLLGFIFEPLLGIAAFIGVIILLMGVHGLADYYKDRSIFNYALFTFIALVIGVVVTLGAFVYLFFLTSFGTDFISLIYPGFNGDWTTLPNLAFNADLDPTALTPYVGPLIEVVAIMWVFTMVAGFLGWQSLKGLATKTKISLFSTAGLLMFIGSVLTILLIGVFLIVAAVLLMTLAFFRLKPSPPESTSPPTILQPTLT